MVQTVTLYHNNRCSKSRAALALLQEHGVKVRVVNYLDTPLSLDELRSVLAKLNSDSVRSMMRVKDELCCELGLDNPDLNNEDLLAAIAVHPELLERPIVVVGDKAVIGRPLENIEALL